MIDALEQIMPTVMTMAPDQLRTLTAHAAGLHAHQTCEWDTADYLRKVALELEAQVHTATMREIANRVALIHRISLLDLLGPGRARQLVHARWEAMWLMRQIKRLDGQHRFSLTQIGRFCGGRDHTTVIHAVREFGKRAYAGTGRAA